MLIVAKYSYKTKEKISASKNLSPTMHLIPRILQDPNMKVLS